MMLIDVSSSDVALLVESDRWMCILWYLSSVVLDVWYCTLSCQVAFTFVLYYVESVPSVFDRFPEKTKQGIE